MSEHKAGEWVSVEKELPGPGVKVIFGYRNQYHRWRTLLGHYAPLHTLEASHWEYGADDTEDGSFEPEGWWEEPVESEMLNFVGDTVSHWMPLPPPPGAEDGQSPQVSGGR